MFDGEEKATNPSDIANLLNKYFVNVGPNLAKTIESNNVSFEQFLPNHINKSVFFKPVDETEVIKITKGLKTSKSSGHDNINTFFMKKIINAIAKPLCHIFNLSISLGKYPNAFKLPKVIPIYKKDNPNLCQNYRPISILPCISKILE